MNKTDRMMAILLELQRRKVVRAEELAAIFETSKRTIYRDMQALSESGVPIIGAPGTGYSLMEGYFLPPVRFTAEEAVALVIGTDFVRQAFDREYADQAGNARRKLEAVLPEAVQEQAEHIRETMRLLPGLQRPDDDRETRQLAVVREAILQRRDIRMRYTSASSEPQGARESEREVSPYGTAWMQGAWMLVGYCHLRGAIRHFRLSRMRELMVLDRLFVMPEGFRLQAYRPQDDRFLLARVRLLTQEVAERMREVGSYYMEEVEESDEGRVAVLRARRAEELLPWLLRWGADIEVLEPASLRMLVREEAEKILGRY